MTERGGSERDDTEQVPSGRERGRDRLIEAAAELLQRPDVALGRMFGSDGYSVGGKLFAFVATSGDLVVKLPEGRIDELRLDNMVMRGRPMREWARVPYDRGVDEWRAMAGEACVFVDSLRSGQGG